MLFVKLLLACFGLACVRATSCINPSVKSSYYSSTDEKLSKDTVFVVEMGIKCANKAENLVLYADVDGSQFPVTASPEGSTYQVSWSIKGKRTQSRTYDVRFFDEEGYNSLKKALRLDPDVTSADAKALFSVEVSHPGLTSGFGIRSELLALAAVSLLFYFVCKERSEVLA